MAKRKFSKKRPATSSDDDLGKAAMKTNSTLADDDDANSGTILGGLSNSPSGKNSLAQALYGKSDNIGE